MRVIKFRGLTIAGEWAYGNLCSTNERIGTRDPGSYISNNAGVPFAYQVRGDTVGQFTGLLDKNGTEIWEGDIVKAHYFYFDGNFDADGERIGEVEISPYEGCRIKGNDNGMPFSATSDIEILGNSHEHAHLLTVKQGG